MIQVGQVNTETELLYTWRRLLIGLAITEVNRTSHWIELFWDEPQKSKNLQEFQILGLPVNKKFRVFFILPPPKEEPSLDLLDLVLEIPIQSQIRTQIHILIERFPILDYFKQNAHTVRIVQKERTAAENLQFYWEESLFMRPFYFYPTVYRSNKHIQIMH